MFDPMLFFKGINAAQNASPETWEKLGQTWPAKMAKGAWNAATLPGDVWRGEVDPMSEESIARATDLAGLNMSGTLASPRGVLGAGPTLPKKNVMTETPPSPMTIQPPQGIRAYHGSPHDFDRFDITKIGTGEGAQVYGHGLYFAENETVARGYKEALSRDKNRAVAGAPELQLPSWVANSIEQGRPVTDLRNEFLGRIQGMRDQLATGTANQPWLIESNITGLENIIKGLDRVSAGAKLTPPGRMYEVNINANPNQFLDWDKPIKPDMAHQLGDAFTGMMGSHYDELSDLLRNSANSGMKGQDAHRWIANTLDKGFVPEGAFKDPAGKAARHTAEYLNEAGIPGIRYLDQGSRAQGEGSFNYVLFNDNLVDILKKYGIAAAAIPTAGAMLNSQEPIANY